MKTKEEIYKMLKRLQAQRNDLKEFGFGSELQKSMLDHTFKSQIDILKEILKGDLRELKIKFGDYKNCSERSRVFPESLIKEFLQ